MNIKDIIKEEGNYLAFIHISKGVEVTCMIKRNQLGSLCGYVKLESWNKFYNSDIHDIPVNVHGGITYSDIGTIGFDCSHIGDLRPYMDPKNTHGVYRDIEFVKSECINLADQIMELNVEEIRNLKISTII